MDKAPAPKLKKTQVRKAVAALLKHLEKEKGDKKNEQLFEDDQIFNLVVALKRAPEKASNKPIRIEIPNSMYNTEGAEVCLFVKDQCEGPKKGEGHKAAKQRVKSIENSGVSKVIGMSKLKANYFPFEAKLKLCDAYDLFLADDRIIPSLPKLIGKTFFKKKKQPIPVDLTKKDWGAQIKKAMNATYTFQSEGSCMNVRVARSSHEEDEIVANIMAAAEQLGNVVPRKWKNIQALYLKTTDSVSLPIFVARPEEVSRIDTPGTIAVAVAEKPKKRKVASS